MRRHLIRLMAVAAAAQCSLAAASDIAADAGIAFGHEKPGEPMAISPEANAKAEAMAIFSDVFLKALGRGSLDPKGVDQLLKALALDPNSPELAKNLIDETVKASEKQREELLAKLFELSERHPDALSLASKLSEIMERSGNRDKAIAILETAVERAQKLSDEGSLSAEAAPFIFPATAKLALLQSLVSRYGDADSNICWLLAQPGNKDSLTSLQAAMAVYSMAKINSPSSPPWWTLGLAESDSERYSGKFKLAVDAFVQAALASKERMSIGRIQRAFIFLKEQGRLADARRIVEHNLSFNPKDVDSLSALARIDFELRDYKGACQAWRDALLAGLGPSAQVYAAYAAALRCSGEAAKAAEILEWQLLVDPGNLAANMQLVVCYSELGKIDKCLARIEKMGDSFEACQLKALCLSRLGRSQEALDMLVKAESLPEAASRALLKDLSYCLLKASLAEKLKKPELVKSSLAQFTSGPQPDSEALNFVGYSLADMNVDLDFAYACIKKAIDLEPGRADYLDSMAWVLYRQGKLKESQEWMDRALKAMKKPEGVLLDHAGDIHLALGDREGALRSWKAAMDAGGQDFEPEKVKAKIEKLQRSQGAAEPK